MKLLLTFSLAFVFVTTSFAKDSSPATLPGGSLFPMLTMASLNNPAAITSTWRTELQGQYSPPQSDIDPKAYAVAFTHSNGIMGINLGYTGSYQEGEAISGAYGGVSARLAMLGFGASLAKSDFTAIGDPRLNLGLMFYLGSYMRFGLVGHDWNGNRQIGLSAGIGALGKLSICGDLLVPISESGVISNKEFSISTGITLHRNAFGFALGGRYNEVDIGSSIEKNSSANGAISLHLGKSWSISLLYKTNPQTFTLALTTVNAPTSNELINRIKSKNSVFKSLF